MSTLRQILYFANNAVKVWQLNMTTCFDYILTGDVFVHLNSVNLRHLLEKLTAESLPSNSFMAAFAASFDGAIEGFKSSKLSDPSVQLAGSAIFVIWWHTHHTILTNQRPGFHRMILRHIVRKYANEPEAEIRHRSPVFTSTTWKQVREGSAQ